MMATLIDTSELRVNEFTQLGSSNNLMQRTRHERASLVSFFWQRANTKRSLKYASGARLSSSNSQIGFLPSESLLASFAVWVQSVSFPVQLSNLKSCVRRGRRLMTWKKLSNAEACLSNHDLKLTDHLKVAKWNVGQVKKAIAAVGQAKTKRPAG